MEFIKEYLDFVIFGLLGFMGFMALWITIERILYYKAFSIERYTQTEILEIDLTRNLTILSIIGANAPFVGLLGTVVGVLIAFYDIGQNQNIDTSAVMIGLALALKATAAGIAIAIPAIIAYNGLQRKVDVLTATHTAFLKRDR